MSELVPRALDAQLQRDAGLSHAAYVVLAMLSESPTRSRRMERVKSPTCLIVNSTRGRSALEEIENGW